MKILLIILLCAIGVFALLLLFAMMKVAGEADDQMERWTKEDEEDYYDTEAALAEKGEEHD